MSNILIADDSLFMRRILKDILSEQYEVIEADSGAKALEQFEKEKPDLVLLDIIMPAGEEEGITVLRSIMEKYLEARVIMITAVGQDAIIEECRKLGAKDYIVKPFDAKMVDETVEKCLGAVHSHTR